MLVRLWFEVGVYLYIVMNDYKGANVGVEVILLKLKKVKEVILKISFVKL